MLGDIELGSVECYKSLESFKLKTKPILVLQCSIIIARRSQLNAPSVIGRLDGRGVASKNGFLFQFLWSEKRGDGSPTMVSFKNDITVTNFKNE